MEGKSRLVRFKPRVVPISIGGPSPTAQDDTFLKSDDFFKGCQQSQILSKLLQFLSSVRLLQKQKGSRFAGAFLFS
jgi:hypothetical protein